MNTIAHFAFIDCGTNTFHLMLASSGEDGVRIYHTEKTTVKIGAGGIEKRIITEEAQLRALNCITDYAAKIRNAGISRVHAYATSAFRNATNGKELRDRIEVETGIGISIIPGDEEAGLICDGVRYALKIGDTPSLIMDIGGGSVEFIIASDQEIFWKQSFEIGAQRLLDRYFHSDPIPPASVVGLQLYLADALSPLTEAVQRLKPVQLIGASGTFDTLSAMYEYLEGNVPAENSPEIPLTINGYYRIHEKLLTANREERLAMPGMADMRVDMIVVASCLIDFVLKMSGISKIRVSQYALKEGALSRVINS